jgi:hypothetical protein
MSLFNDLSAAALREAAGIKEEIHTLENRLKAIFGVTPATPTTKSSSVAVTLPKVNGKKTISAAAKRKIGAAQKARWAKFHAAKSEVKAGKVVSASKVSTLKTATPFKKKAKMSVAGKSAISAAAKARWAKVKAAKNVNAKTESAK